MQSRRISDHALNSRQPSWIGEPRKPGISHNRATQGVGLRRIGELTPSPPPFSLVPIPSIFAFSISSIFWQHIATNYSNSVFDWVLIVFDIWTSLSKTITSVLLRRAVHIWIEMSRRLVIVSTTYKTQSKHKPNVINWLLLTVSRS